MDSSDRDDREAVERCVRDYFEAWYEGDAARMRGALHPELAKRGYLEVDGALALARETSDSMVDFTQLGVGTKTSAERRSLTVWIDDLYGNIATATVDSPVYREYVHLVRTPKGWRIVNSLWQPTTR